MAAEYRSQGGGRSRRWRLGREIEKGGGTAEDERNGSYLWTVAESAHNDWVHSEPSRPSLFSILIS